MQLSIFNKQIQMRFQDCLQILLIEIWLVFKFLYDMQMKEFEKAAFTDFDETYIYWSACMCAYVTLPKIIDEYNLNDK